MKLILGILLLVGLAAAASSATFLKLRRSTSVGLLVSGGWLGILVGLLIGPSGMGILDRPLVVRSSPLLTIGLGWIGLMVGLQLRRDVLLKLPASIFKLTIVDVTGSLILFGALGVFGLSFWLEETNPTAMLIPATLLATAAIGWTAEMRSLRLLTAENASQALSLRGAASLATPIAIVVFSVSAGAIQGTDAATLTVALGSTFVRLFSVLLIAIALGVIARFGLRRANDERAELLAIFLGVVAMISGVATELHVTPLLAAMFVGIVIANLAGRELRRFERFILEAEHVVATIYWIVAGVLLDAQIGPIGVAIALSFVALRALCKPLLVTFGADRSTSAHSEADHRRLNQLAPVRQNPLALMLGVTLVLIEPSTVNHQLLAIVALIGLVGDLYALLRQSISSRSSQPSPVPTAAPAPPGLNTSSRASSAEAQS